jgi:transposase
MDSGDHSSVIRSEEIGAPFGSPRMKPLVGLEACATAHHWARELIALGHDARLMPPNYVKAYVKRNKHDVADAEAIPPCYPLVMRR